MSSTAISVEAEAEARRSITKFLENLVDAHGTKATVDTLARLSGYESTPPTLDEFVDDTYYLRDVFETDDPNKHGLYPIWRSALRGIYPSPFHSPYLQVGLTGSIGGGKSTCSLTGLAYDITRLSHLKSPAQYCGLASSTKITFALINATVDLAKGVLMDQLEDWISVSPYLKQLRAKSGRRTYFDKNLHIVQGSRFTHTQGQAMVSALLTELNFQDRVKDQAYDNYTNAKRRLQSRFLRAYKERGMYPGRIWLDSSKNDAADFMETFIQDHKNDPLVTIHDNPIWAIQEHFGIYSGEKFKVFIGDRSRDPRMIRQPRDIIGIPEELIIDVPIEYHMDFEVDIYSALRDLAGRGTWSQHIFIPSAEMIDRAFQGKNPVKREVISLDFFDKSEYLVDYLDLTGLTTDKTPRYIHIDLGLTGDKTGIACTKCAGFVEVRRTDMTTFSEEVIREPIYVTEWVLAVEGRNGYPVPIYKLKTLIINLVARGIPVGMVSTDGFQSDNLRQDLMLAGIPAEKISVDETKVPYDTLKNSILEGRYHGPDHPLLRKEISKLVDMGKKIDHPPKGCFTGSTKVSSPDGSELTLRDVHRKFHRGDEVWVYTIDKENQTVRPARVSDCFITKKVARLVQVTLDNEEKIQCTPDHRFMLRDGTYREAKDLKSGDSLMPLYRKYPSQGEMKPYRLFYNPLTDLWHYEHRQFCLDRPKKGTVAHHDDLVKEVKAIDYVDLPVPVPVYDLTVDDTHNFALSAGVFVHNSKDLADGVAGSIISCMKRLADASGVHNMNDFMDAYQQSDQRSHTVYSSVAGNKLFGS